MKKIKRSWDLLSEAKRRSCVEEIMVYFQRERDEKIGMLAAEDVLDFMLKSVAKDIYEKGIKDAKELLKRRLDDLDVEMDLLVDG
ncbi:DUF2164 family protein [Candidatus Peregrinibacteria bacterium]|jgi:uncharacterized protein (DUF2164 family)|nr:DUF2164 family protein [Candidatus Peregrinibacteria bacterium]